MGRSHGDNMPQPYYKKCKCFLLNCPLNWPFWAAIDPEWCNMAASVEETCVDIHSNWGIKTQPCLIFIGLNTNENMLMNVIFKFQVLFKFVTLYATQFSTLQLSVNDAF